MKMEKIKNQNERAIERAKGVKALKEEYGDITADEINELSLVDAAAIADQNEKLKKRLGEKRLKLQAELDMADMKQKAEIKHRIREIEALKKEADAFDPESMKAHMQLDKMRNKLREIELQGEIDIETVKAKGKNKIDAIKADGRISRKRKFGQAISALFKGFGDSTKDDIVSADNAAELAKKKLAKSKADYTKKMLDSATKLLRKQFKSHNYTLEQQEEVAERIIQEILRQAENSK